MIDSLLFGVRQIRRLNVILDVDDFRFIASKIVNKAGQGIVMDVVLGIIGAVAGGWLFNNTGHTDERSEYRAVIQTGFPKSWRQDLLVILTVASSLKVS